jgi:translation initiation factor 4A
MLHTIRLREKTTQAMVLSPTRELADQIYTFFCEIGARLPDLTIAVVTGGSTVEDSQGRTAALPHIVIATPGRALGLIKAGYLRTENMRTVCLDEADELLSDHFVRPIEQIFSFLSPDLQCLLFSATFPEHSFDIIDEFIQNPVKIQVKSEQLTLEGIKQFYVNAQDQASKFATLIDIYGGLSIQKAIIFANSRQAVDELESGFHRAGFAVSAIHSGLEQAQRDSVMKDFRTGLTRVLLSTDLLGRGIDVQQITLVINYQLPEDFDQYLHRIGRSGRYGRKGVTINICEQSEMATVAKLQAYYQTAIEELPGNFAEVVRAANEQLGDD